jgi:hypothetical protein
LTRVENSLQTRVGIATGLPPVAAAKQEQLGSRRPCPGFFVVQLRIR